MAQTMNRLFRPVVSHLRERGGTVEGEGLGGGAEVVGSLGLGVDLLPFVPAQTQAFFDAPGRRAGWGMDITTCLVGLSSRWP